MSFVGYFLGALQLLLENPMPPHLPWQTQLLSSVHFIAHFVSFTPFLFIFCYFFKEIYSLKVRVTEKKMGERASFHLLCHSP